MNPQQTVLIILCATCDLPSCMVMLPVRLLAQTLVWAVVCYFAGRGCQRTMMYDLKNNNYRFIRICDNLLLTGTCLIERIIQVKNVVSWKVVL